MRFQVQIFKTSWVQKTRLSYCPKHSIGNGLLVNKYAYPWSTMAYLSCHNMVVKRDQQILNWFDNLRVIKKLLKVWFGHQVSYLCFLTFVTSGLENFQNCNIFVLAFRKWIIWHQILLNRSWCVWYRHTWLGKFQRDSLFFFDLHFCSVWPFLFLTKNDIGLGVVETTLVHTSYLLFG